LSGPKANRTMRQAAFDALKSAIRLGRGSAFRGIVLGAVLGGLAGIGLQILAIVKRGHMTDAVVIGALGIVLFTFAGMISGGILGGVLGTVCGIVVGGIKGYLGHPRSSSGASQAKEHDWHNGTRTDSPTTC